MPHDLIDTEDRCDACLQVILARRAAEQFFYGSALSGSCRMLTSDLAKATHVAVAVETSLGFGKRQPLLYRDPDHWQSLVRSDREVAHRVSKRLERAEQAARRLMETHLDDLRLFADALFARGTLESEALSDLVARISGVSGEPKV